ncbi:hypothetical protein ACLB2K_054152 [Fragaria x ananassa]
MASAVTTCLSLPPTPRPCLTFSGSSLNLPISPPKTFRPFQTAVFSRSFSAEVRERPRVLVPFARSLGGCAWKNNELPSDLTKRGGRSLYKYWRQRAIQSENENEAQISHEDLYKVMKILVSILSFVSVDGDPSKGISEERCESILQYIPYNDEGAHLPEDCAPHLARLLNRYNDIRATQQRFRELEFQEPLGLRGNLLSLIRPCWCYFKSVAAFSARGLLYFLLFAAFVIYRCATRPVSSEPEFCFGLGILTALVSLLEKLRASRYIITRDYLAGIIETLIWCMRVHEWTSPSCLINGAAFRSYLRKLL